MDQEHLDSFSRALELYLKQLDIRYEQIKLIAASVEFLNRSHHEYKDNIEKFEGILDNIFELKEAWYEARKLVGK